MKYYHNDIVEIISAKYKGWSDVPKHKKEYYKHQNIISPMIGQRFRVDSMEFENGECVALFSHRDDVFWEVKPECVILYKRPLTNWIKSILNINNYSG